MTGVAEKAFGCGSVKSKTILKNYFKAITEVAGQGDAREESFYSCLEDLFGQFAASSGRTEVHVTTLPKKTEAGNPDFRVWNGHDQITGYVEAKRPTEENLDHTATTDQLKRYLHTFPNLLLTNFFEFLLFRNGQLIERVLAARPYVLHKLGTVPPVEKGDELFGLFEKFFSFTLPKSYTAESLAVELAKRTRFLRDVVADQLAEEKEEGEGNLLGFYEAFQKYLIANLTLEDFSDLYAQTITYGLFAARTRAKNGFNRKLAFDNIPRTIGILRDVFQFISLGDLPKQLEWIVDDISEVLAVADAGGILERFYRDGKGSDPVVHFYETFLAEYDPKERERRGVYYTPEPVVSYIVRSLHKLLKEKFGKSDGLASEGVTLLDPAAGTMTFVARASQEAVKEFEQKYGSGGREGFIKDHILKNYYAFELMMAPYAVGHLKMSFFLEELGHRLTDDERFQFYLTNTLEMEELEQTHLPGMASLAQESRLAGEVKAERPILVVLGNPPYSVSSVNKSAFIAREMEAYKELVRSERNLMPLSDDYVKFLRFAQWKIDRSGVGLVGMITNHSYLDNPTFRGMRYSLMKTFDEIYVLDLHGNSLKREICPDGSKDENVFDIRPGAAIALLVRHQGNQKAKVHHADLWGSRENKYEWLQNHDIKTTEWEVTASKPELYLFLPRDEAALKRYNEFVPVTQVFPVNSTGIKTHRDHFVIDFDREALKRRIRMFLDSKLPDEFVRETFELKDNRDWKLAEKRGEIQKDGDWEDKIAQCLYRPFDRRWVFYHYHAIDFGREAVMRHVTLDNVALVTMRQVVLNEPYTHAVATSCIVDNRTFVSSKGTTQILPLYLYPDTSQEGLFASVKAGEHRKPNLNAKLLGTLKAEYGDVPNPEKIFHYIYAVLYADTYRKKYAEFLKTDFPRIPFSADFALFQSLAALGERIVGLHLLRSEELDPPAARFQGKGDNRVAGTKGKGFRYEPKEERVYINKTQYFEPVPRELWEYQIGGYQVLSKWLKDRKDRVLSLDEIKTYCRIVTAIQKTIEIQKEIDALYPDVEKKIIKNMA
ncbi:MAG: type ISP restriction/modification enzyme [Thermodesulfobacteriota bacterium]|nr:type ISP restriction/modification enzyme [Thermodesulfobacteriota bacterium]